MALPRYNVVPKGSVAARPGLAPRTLGPDWADPLKKPTGAGGAIAPTTAISSGFTDPLAGTSVGAVNVNYTPQTADFSNMSDYRAELESSPEWANAQTIRNANVEMARNSLRDSIRRAVVQSGYNVATNAPGDLAGYMGDIDATTLAAAQQNQMSDRAQLEKALNQGMTALPYKLAARGALGSGLAATQTSALREDFDQASYNRLNQVLDAIRGGVGQYTGAVSSEDANLQQMRMQIAQMLMKLKPPAPVAPATPAAAEMPWATPSSPGRLVDAYQQAVTDAGRKRIQ